MSDSVSALSAQSAANRKSRAMSSCTLVLACSLRRLKTLPSVRNRKRAPTSPSPKASVSMAENIMPKRVGAKTQPCFTLLVTGNGSEYSRSSCNLAFMPSWNCWTIAMNFAGQPNLAMIFHSPSRQTVSNAFIRSTKVVYSLTFCSWHFSCSWRAAKIMSALPRPARNPHWVSGSRSRSRWTLRRFSRIRARIFPAMESREIPRWLSQEFLFPLRLYRWMIEASLSS